MTNFYELQGKINHWSQERGILKNGTASGQLKKAIEESNEGLEAISAGSLEAFKDALGDLGVCWLNACFTAGYDPTEMLEIAYDQIKDRRGHMGDDGVFYKNA